MRKSDEEGVGQSNLKSDSRDRSSSLIMHGSLQKRRVSWGPSKVLEFLAAEKFNSAAEQEGAQNA